MTPAPTAGASAPAGIPLHYAPTPNARRPRWTYPGDYGFPEELLTLVRRAWRERGDYDPEHQDVEDGRAAVAIVETLLYVYPEIGRS
ncbi:hypothetical protein [Saccharothrix sp. ST-888]|uniref:hypothetical protein n=1 Tax=Saccharothrix sp. ST-888 TaxID=1427391 RepID=UPI0005ED2926|nr:hypothetical protein [Saccharothrix sp. ST-888]KJK56134.1 hypothetical protein UK12_24665 [Saccharothrix sp. ST-888]